MQDKKLDEMSSEELKRKQKSLKTGMGILGAMVIVLATTASYLLGKGTSVFVLLPVAFLPFFMGIGGQLKKIRVEIDRRNL